MSGIVMLSMNGGALLRFLLSYECRQFNRLGKTCSPRYVKKSFQAVIDKSRFSFLGVINWQLRNNRKRYSLA